MPWQQSGIKAGRTWVIGTTEDVLRERVQRLFAAPADQKSAAFKESPTGCKLSDQPMGWIEHARLPALRDSSSAWPLPALAQLAYRSFDRQLVVADPRFIDRPSPSLWKVHSPAQIYFSSLVTAPLAEGPALTVSAEVPDLHVFRGSFGAKDILPLWRDAAATQPNLHPRLLETLGAQYGRAVTAPDIAAYLYAVLAQPAYTARFAAELQNRAVHVPVTLDGALFDAACALGRRLLYLHSYGERFAENQTWPAGRARCTRAVAAQDGAGLPQRFAYDPARQVLQVGTGEFAPVAPAVWNFEVSGLKVVQSWLGYRMRLRKGRKSSPLDDIAPAAWPAEYTTELLALLHLLEETLTGYGAQADLLERILAGPLLSAQAIGPPPPALRTAPATTRQQESLDL